MPLQAIEEYRAGVPVRDIVRRYGLCLDSLYQALSTRGIPRRRPPRVPCFPEASVPHPVLRPNGLMRMPATQVADALGRWKQGKLSYAPAVVRPTRAEDDDSIPDND